MKRIILFSGLFLLFVGTSCKKNRNCMCTKTYVGADTTWTSIKGTVIENKKKKEAITECSSFDKSTTLLTETLTIKCEIK